MMQLSNQHNKKNIRGSLTVESCISLTFFLSLFLLLLFIAKLACVDILLDHAASETAKQMAAYSYPISFLNNYQAELFSGMPGDILTQPLDELKNKGSEALASQMMVAYLNHNWIDKTKVKIQFVELPLEEEEFNRKKATYDYSKCGLLPGTDFTQDDVVIQITYDYPLKLPFFAYSSITLVQTAIEKAWLNGGHVILNGADPDKKDTIVYITRTGKKYHLGSCRYLRKSKIDIELTRAKEKGYEPCKVCKPPE